MTAKRKSKELFESMYNEGLSDRQAKECALIAVDEIIDLHKGKFLCEREEQNESYWQEVKQEINNL